jgi:hypothetical protein
MVQVVPHEITRTEIIQILNTVTFYTRVPAFLFMREQGYASSCSYLLAVTGKERAGAAEDAILKPAFHSFFRMLTEIMTHAPDQMKAFKKFVSDCLGYTPERLVVYYTNEDGNKIRLDF